MANPFATEAKRFSNVVKWELAPEVGYCRDTVTAYEAAEKTYVPGTVLGRVITSGTATATADSGNTGNGTMGAITVTAPAKVGTYRLVFTAAASNAGTFLVIDPDGVAVGTGTVAVAFSDGGLAFTLADGATDFAVGDGFSIAVAGTYQYKAAVETATDGSKVPAAIAVEETVVAATTATKIAAIIKGPMIVSKSGLVLDATYNTAGEKTIVYAALEKLGINCVDAV